MDRRRVVKSRRTRRGKNIQGVFLKVLHPTATLLQRERENLEGAEQLDFESKWSKGKRKDKIELDLKRRRQNPREEEPQPNWTLNWSERRNKTTNPKSVQKKKVDKLRRAFSPLAACECVCLRNAPSPSLTSFPISRETFRALFFDWKKGNRPGVRKKERRKQMLRMGVLVIIMALKKPSNFVVFRSFLLYAKEIVPKDLSPSLPSRLLLRTSLARYLSVNRLFL